MGGRWARGGREMGERWAGDEREIALESICRSSRKAGSFREGSITIPSCSFPPFLAAFALLAAFVSTDAAVLAAHTLRC